MQHLWNTALKGQPVDSLAQATMYVATLVTPSLAYLDLGEKMKQVSVPMISCRTNKNDEPDMLPFLEGYLRTPVHCGTKYSYGVTRNGTGVDDAVNFYLSHVQQGINIAVQGIENLCSKNLSVLPLSSMQGPFYSTHNFEMVASAVRSGSERISIHFGDMWKGTVSANQLKECCKGSQFERDSYFQGENDEPIKVIAKVSNSLMHGGWGVDSARCEIALNDCKKILKEQTSLVFARRLQSGLLIVMKDLHEQSDIAPKGYFTLTPSEWRGHLVDLWGQFRCLVTNVLIPAALEGVVFTDLRFGYDVMGNIMVAGMADDKESWGKQLELVDFDSFLSLLDYHKPDDNRYIIGDGIDATTFVFIQVFLVGLSWKNRLGNKKFNATGYSKEIIQRLEEKACTNSNGLLLSCGEGNVRTMLDSFDGILGHISKLTIEGHFATICDLKDFRAPTFVLT